MKATDFWKYKIFEFGLTKSGAVDENSCEKAGYSVYKSTDTHGVPGLISIELDMFGKPAQEDDSVHTEYKNHVDEIKERVKNVDLKKIYDDNKKQVEDSVKEGLDWLINGN